MEWSYWSYVSNEIDFWWKELGLAKDLTPAERRRLSGQIEALMEKGAFTDEDLLEEILKRTA